MKRRLLSFVLALIMMLSLLPAAVFADSLGDVRLTVKANDTAGLGGDVTVAFSQSNGKYTGTLYLPGGADTSKLFFSWPESVSVEGYASGKAPIAAAGRSVSYNVSCGGKTANFSVTTMQGSTGVNGLFLRIDESLGTISAMNSDRAHETSCYGELSMDGKAYPMSIKGRGNTTWQDFAKKPYNITIFKDFTFDKKDGVKLIDGVKSKKWTITSNSKDPTCLRNKIGFDIAEELGIGLPSESIDVWMNGEYLGNYLLTPKNDYQVTDEGYMVEIDNLNDVDQFTLPSSPMFTVKDMADGMTVADVKNSVSKAWDALLKSGSDEYLKYFDLDSWAKLYLLNELYKDVDVSAGSIFFTKASLSDSDKLTAGPVWDLDGTLGRLSHTYINVDRMNETGGGGWYIDGINGYPTPFFQQLGKHESFMKRVYEIYNENKAAFDGIMSDLYTQSTLIEASAKMNYARWPQYMTNTEHFSVSNDNSVHGNDAYKVTYCKTDSWEDYIYNLREYLTKRLAFLSDQLTTTALTGSISGRTTLPEGERTTLTAEVSTEANTRYQWQSSADGKSWTDIAGATAKTYSAAAENGMSYRCIVSVPARTINTNRVAKITLPAAGTVLKGVTIITDEPDPAGGFTDIGSLIPEFQEAIRWAAQTEIVNGYDDNTFRPNTTCTRGQAVTFLWRAAGCPEPTGKNPFVDVENAGFCKPYYKAIVWAAEQGITTGFDAAHFDPNATVTRAQFVTFLWRCEGRPAASGVVKLTDLDGLNADFAAAIKWAAAKGVVSGYADGTFRPNSVCTRAHVVAFLFRDR